MLYIYINYIKYIYVYIYIHIHNNDGLRNNYSMRLKVSCLCNYQEHMRLLI